jgi:hypothetical protein
MYKDIIISISEYTTKEARICEVLFRAKKGEIFLRLRTLAHWQSFLFAGWRGPTLPRQKYVEAEGMIFWMVKGSVTSEDDVLLD